MGHIGRKGLGLTTATGMAAAAVAEATAKMEAIAVELEQLAANVRAGFLTKPPNE